MNCLYPVRLNMKKIAKPQNLALLPNDLDVPCGKCINCLLDKNMEWQFRCYCEYLSRGSVATFLTLTVDDIHNTRRVSKKDVQTFFKSFRNTYFLGKNKTIEYSEQDSFSYVCTSEYGSESFRPHYHIILFGVDVIDLITNYNLNKRFQILGRAKGGFRFNWSIWSKGFCHAEPLTPQLIKYCLKYLLKGRLRDPSICGDYPSYNDMLDNFGFEPLFFLKSKGIGKNYFEEHLGEIQANGGLYVNGRFHTLPPYWSRKYDTSGIVFGSREYYKNKQLKTRKRQQEKIDFAGMTTFDIENMILRNYHFGNKI